MTNLPLPFSIDTLKLGPMENFIYLIHDHASGRVAVVDPAWEPEAILARVRAKNLRITDILLTHSHDDHINAVDAVLAQYDAPVHLLKDEAGFWGRSMGVPTLHHGGDVIALGDTRIDILHTPGHTPGSACYRVGDNLIAGDTLFIFGCGRCDLRGGDAQQMYDTLRRLRMELPASTLVLPGHDYADRSVSSMQEQIDGNPFFHFEKRSDFVQYRMHGHNKTRRPPLTPMPKPRA
jgi:glyoxylase-like metal-dependent hydrolase (beta-lactamase superfamily II)